MRPPPFPHGTRMTTKGAREAKTEKAHPFRTLAPHRECLRSTDAPFLRVVQTSHARVALHEGRAVRRRLSQDSEPVQPVRHAHARCRVRVVERAPSTVAASMAERRRALLDVVGEVGHARTGADAALAEVRGRRCGATGRGSCAAGWRGRGTGSRRTLLLLLLLLDLGVQVERIGERLDVS